MNNVQNDPEKIAGNYNEFQGVRPGGALRGGTFEILRAEEQYTTEPQEIIETGLRLVNGKVDEVLGDNNKLTKEDLVFPEVQFVATLPEYPNSAGCFFSDSNKIVIVMDKIQSDTLSRTKVFIHEYIHFLSHNGHDDGERLDQSLSIAQNNNIGFRRNFGLDIRDGKEGKMTGDYFLAFNEAVTEQLAIDILPGVHETYGNYRGLLNQVIDDAVTCEVGWEDENSALQPWPREQVKTYIYECFFKGDLSGFTALLKEIYKKYDISEQQFGLMTHKNDLPSVLEKKWASSDPKSPSPSPAQVARLVQKRLDSKMPDDYITDVINSELGDGGNTVENKYGAEYDTYVKDNDITPFSKEIIEGREYEVDSLGFLIYHDEDASSMLDYIRGEFDDLLVKFESREVGVTDITKRMDVLLFDTYRMSMLSDGFRNFYIYKHEKIDNL